MRILLSGGENRTGDKVTGSALVLSSLVLSFDLLLSALQCERPHGLKAFPILQDGIDEERVFFKILSAGTLKKTSGIGRTRKLVL